MWPTVKKGVEHLLRNRDAETGLVGPSFDLWEEKQALHTYTNAAATAALRESAKIASTIGYEVLSNAWSNESKNLQTAILKHLWDEQTGRFLKSVKPHDSSIDTAILGLTYPFRVLEPDDPRILSTSRQIENAFTYASEGIGRYPGDTYHGGNHCLITNPWMGHSRGQQGNNRKAKTRIEWCVGN